MQAHELEGVMLDFVQIANMISKTFGDNVSQYSQRWSSYFSGNTVEVARLVLNDIERNITKPLRPADLIALLEKHSNKISSPCGNVFRSSCPITNAALRADELGVEASELVGAAWVWYHWRVHGAPLVDAFNCRIKISDEDALRIINEQCKKFGYDDLLPDEFRLQEIWQD